MKSVKTIDEILYALEYCGSGREVSYSDRVYAAGLIRKLDDENRALRTELLVNKTGDSFNPGGEYWQNICALNARQENKGMKKYGEPLEENTTLTTAQRIEHAQEEAIDLLKYLEHLKKVVDADGITANDYQRACLRTATSDKSEWLENAIYGIIGEAGEIVDLVKKHKWQGHELDKEALILEAGDLSWYVSLLLSSINCTLGESFEKNIEKLKNRYPSGFDKTRSINRENAQWADFVKNLKHTKQMVKSYLNSGEVTGKFDGNNVCIYVNSEMEKGILSKPDIARSIEEDVIEFTGSPKRLAIFVKESGDSE